MKLWIVSIIGATSVCDIEFALVLEELRHHRPELRARLDSSAFFTMRSISGGTFGSMEDSGMYAFPSTRSGAHPPR